MHPGSLSKPESFKRQGRWYICKLCDAASKEKEKMSMTAAKIHEKSEEHINLVQKEEWDSQNGWAMIPTGASDWGIKKTDYSDWEPKPDKLTLIVEHWYKGVEAAHRGEDCEELFKFESFFETLGS